MNVLPLTGLLLAALFLAACSEKENDNNRESTRSDNVLVIPAQELEELDVKTDAAVTRTMKGIISVPARVIPHPDMLAAVNSLIRGRIKSVFVQAGDEVKAGQLLASVESVELGVLTADLLRYHAEHGATRSAYERLKRLHDDGVGSEKYLQAAEAEFLSARAGYRSTRQRLLAIGIDENDLEALLNNTDDRQTLLKLRSPIRGTVVIRDAVVGQLVGDEELLFEVLNSSTVLVEGNAFDKDFRDLRKGLVAHFHSQSFGDTAFSGNITFVSSVLDDKTHSLPVRVRIDQASPMLKPNLFGRLDIEAESTREVLSIPSSAIVYDGDERFVFVRENETNFRYLRVETGREGGDRIEILTGIDAGQQVVSNGVFNLKSRLKLSQMEEE